MDKILKRWFMPSIICLLVSCSDNETTPQPAFTFENGTEISLGSAIGDQALFAFSSSAGWTADGQSDWYTLSPTSGNGSDGQILVTATAGNHTGEERKDTFLLHSGNLSQSIIVTQEIGEYIKTEQSEYHVPTEGGYLTVNFSSNVNLQYLVISSDAEWLTEPGTKSAKAGTKDYYVPLLVLPNTNEHSRTAYLDFYCQTTTGDGILLTTVTITQDGSTSTDESTDYSADKTVKTLQTATIGQGIPIVLMGDGFMDKDIEDGTYDEVMDKALENLFSEEPIRSLRDYFTVYSVTAVSKNSEFGMGYETAFECQLDGNGSTGISGNLDIVAEYAQCVEDINLEQTLAVVILNSTEYAGTTYFGFANSSGTSYSEFAISFCPIIYGLDHEMFRTVLSHEAVGHGFAKLSDEYAYESYGTISMPEILQIQYQQDLMGWSSNVDFTSDPEEVLWAAFLADARYEEEQLGVFEGACTYWKGAYRPSEESIMNSNTGGFNAPSRQSIYDKTVKLGEGRNPDYEEFVTFDLLHPVQSNTKRAYTGSSDKKFAPPRLVYKGEFTSSANTR